MMPKRRERCSEITFDNATARLTRQAVAKERLFRSVTGLCRRCGNFPRIKGVRRNHLITICAYCRADDVTRLADKRATLLELEWARQKNNTAA